MKKEIRKNTLQVDLEQIGIELAQIGLSKGETKVYLALLTLGESTKTPLVKESGVSSSKLYEILDRLVSKGLVSSYHKNAIMHYKAANPSRILAYLESKESEIKSQKEKIQAIIPSLEQFDSQIPTEFSAITYEGIKGIQTAMEELLNTDAKLYQAMGVTSKRNPVFNRVWAHWHEQRIKQGISAELLIVEQNTEYVQKLASLLRTKVRYIPWLTPTTIGILGQKVIIVDYSQKPSCVIITNPNISQSFSEFFLSLWKTGTKQ
jgi:HTH-type transcriptional regulator, sugar sensing transcriptional regulator